MNNQQYIKWCLELCNQEGYANPKEIELNYNSK